MNAGFNLFFFLCCNFLANSFYLCKIIDGFKTVSSLLGFLGANVCCLRVFLAPTAALSFSENSVSREELAACLQRTSWSPYLFACARFLTDTDSVILPYRCHSLQILLRYFCIFQRTLVSFAFALAISQGLWVPFEIAAISSPLL